MGFVLLLRTIYGECSFFLFSCDNAYANFITKTLYTCKSEIHVNDRFLSLPPPLLLLLY